MKAKDYLKQLEKLKRIMINKENQQIELYERATSITSRLGEKVQSSFSNQKMADAIDRCVDLKEEIDKCYQKRKEILSTMEELECKDYTLLYMIYEQGMNMYDIADDIGKQYATITTMHGRALEQMQKILDRKEQYGKTEKTENNGRWL